MSSVTENRNLRSDSFAVWSWLVEINESQWKSPGHKVLGDSIMKFLSEYYPPITHLANNASISCANSFATTWRFTESFAVKWPPAIVKSHRKNCEFTNRFSLTYSFVCFIDCGLNNCNQIWIVDQIIDRSSIFLLLTTHALRASGSIVTSAAMKWLVITDNHALAD